MRVVHTLGDQGYVKVTPGRAGGIVLARDPGEIRLGEVVRNVEPNLNLVECFDPATNTCPIPAACALKFWLRDALAAFLAELDRHTLAEMLLKDRHGRLQKLFRVAPVG